MSFLLRQPKRNGSNNDRMRKASASNSDRGRILPRPQQGINRNRKQPQNLQKQSSKPMVQSTGNQILLQRQVRHTQKQQFGASQQRNISKSQTKTRTTQAMPQKQEQEIPGVISMTEVLEDLRVLEQQQKDAQRKLAQARMTKDQRLQQHTGLESKLEGLKYSNGELRAQIRQYRETLSCGTRELGSRRLATGRNGNDIRAFEGLLKNGLKSARVFVACRRKIDSAIIVVENKNIVLKRIQAQEKQKLEELQGGLQEKQRHDQALRASIQQEVGQSQILAKDISAVRAGNSEIEQEMLDAKNMEESTKIRAEGVVTQISSERQRHKDAISRNKVQMEQYHLEEAKVLSAEEGMVVRMKENDHELQAVKAHIKECREESLGGSYLVCGSEDALPSIDRSRIAHILQGEDVKANDQEKANMALKEEIAKVEAMLRKTKEETADANDRKMKLVASAHDQEETEKVRRKKLDAAKDELTNEKAEVSKLQQAVKDFEQTRKNQKEENERRLAESEAAAAQNRVDIARLRKDIESADAQTADDVTAWVKEKASICSRLEYVKEKAKTTENLLQGLAEKYESLNTENEGEFKRRSQETEKLQSDHIEKFDAEMSKLVERYPALSKVTFEYDGNKTREEQAEQVLKPITSGFEQDIVAAETARQARTNELRRKADELAAAEKREEEARRLAAEKLAVAQKREEEARRLAAEELAAAQRREEEARRLEAEELAAAQKHEEEVRRLEAEKLAAAQKRAEDARQRAAEEFAAAARREEEARRLEAEARIAARRREEAANRRKAEERATAKRREEERREAEERTAARSREEEERKRTADERAATHKREERERREADADLSRHKEGVETKEKQRRNSKLRRRKGADFFYPNSQGDISEEETPAHPKRLLPAFVRTAQQDLPSPQGTLTTQNTDKRVRWDDNLGDDDNQDDSDFSDAISSEDEKENTPTNKHGDKRKTYSKSRRRLGAMSASSRKEMKSLANVEGSKSTLPTSHRRSARPLGGMDTASMKGQTSDALDYEKADPIQQEAEDIQNKSSKSDILDISSDEDSEPPKRPDAGNHRSKPEKMGKRVSPSNFASDDEEETSAPRRASSVRSKSSSSKTSKKRYRRSSAHSKRKESPHQSKERTILQSATGITETNSGISVGTLSEQKDAVADRVDTDNGSKRRRTKKTSSSERVSEHVVKPGESVKSARGAEREDFSTLHSTNRKHLSDVESGSHVRARKDTTKTAHAKDSQIKTSRGDVRGSSQTKRKRAYVEGGQHDTPANQLLSASSPKHDDCATKKARADTANETSLGNHKSKASNSKKLAMKGRGTARSTKSDKPVDPLIARHSDGSKKQRRSGGHKDDSNRRRSSENGRGPLDSLTTGGSKPGSSNGLVPKRASSTKDNGATTGVSKARRSEKESSRSRPRDKTDAAARKRNASDLSMTQTSGLSSSEGAMKQRRRKKKEMPVSRKTRVSTVTDSAYDFSF